MSNDPIEDAAMTTSLPELDAHHASFMVALSAHPGPDDIEIWHSLLGLEKDLPLASRKSCAREVIVALDRAASSFLPTPKQREELYCSSFHWRALALQQTEAASNFERNRQKEALEFNKKFNAMPEKFGDVILAFSRAFGWEKDQHAIMLAFEDEARSGGFIDLLRALEIGRAAKRGNLKQADVEGLPVFEEAELTAWKSCEGEKAINHAVALLEQRKITGRWPRGRRIRDFFLALNYIASYFPAIYGWLWLAACFLIIFGRKVLTGQFAPFFGGIGDALLWLPLLGLHINVMMRGYRHLLNCLGNDRKAVNKQQIFHPAMRYSYLQTCQLKRNGWTFLVGLMSMIFVFVVVLLAAIPAVQQEGAEEQNAFWLNATDCMRFQDLSNCREAELFCRKYSGDDRFSQTCNSIRPLFRLKR